MKKVPAGTKEKSRNHVNLSPLTSDPRRNASLKRNAVEQKFSECIIHSFKGPPPPTPSTPTLINRPKKIPPQVVGAADFQLLGQLIRRRLDSEGE